MILHSLGEKKRSELQTRTFFPWIVLVCLVLVSLASLPVSPFHLSKKKAVSPVHLELVFAPFSYRDYYLLIFGSLVGHPETVIEWHCVPLRSSCIPPKIVTGKY